MKFNYSFVRGEGGGGYCNKKTSQLVKQRELSPCLLTDELELMFEKKRTNLKENHWRPIPS